MVEVPGAPYSDDTKGYALNPTEEVEPSYKVDAPRVLVQAETAADYNWTGGSGKVTVTDGASIGGRQNVVAAAGVGNDNSQTIGVLIDGNNFAFEEDDIITYSYDIYLTSETYARTWIRDMGDYSPYITIESSDHYVNANKWTTIKKTLTYADLTAAAASGWTDAGKFVVCIRPGVAQTVYLDNFVVKVTKADDNYLSNAATGARVEWTNPLNEWDNNVMYGSNITNFDYVADPAGERSSNVLEAVVGTAGAYGVVAVKVIDDFGSPITSLAAGEIVDVSFDFRSSVAQGSSTNGVSLRIGDTSFSNGVNAPTGTAYDMGSVQVAANTWTTIKASYTVTADLSLTSGQTWYIPVRVPTAGTIYMDNFKLSIRNPEDSALAPTWEAQSASDITWKGASSAATVIDATDPAGTRGTVIKATVAGNSNDNNVGLLIGNPYQFQEGDILTYSVDVYSSTINPDIWLREQGSGLQYTTFYNTVTANTWTTLTKTITYAELVAANANLANSGKYALYIRPRASGTHTIYIDNFKVEVFNINKHVVDLVDGAKIKVGGEINEAADLTENAATLTAGQSIGGKSNVVKVVSVGGHGGRVGLKVADNYTIKQGDVLEYSVTIYPTAEMTLKSGYAAGLDYILFRNSTTTPYRNVAPDVTLEANKWQTITNRIAFDDLSANLMGGTTWDVEGDYSLYFRYAGTYYISNFTAKIVRPEYAFGELPSNASLEKGFSALSGSQTLSFDVFVPSTGANGFKAKLGGATFSISDGKFYLNGTEVYTATNNVWYNINVITDGATASVKVNGDAKASGISASGEMTAVSFENTAGKQIMIDNVEVAPTYEASDFTDYPVLSDSDIATPSGDLSLGMVSYPMWREGIHYGWDLITPYENRVPTLGYYTGGSQEVADWNIKWWAEHGFDHVIYPFVRPDITEAGGQPSFSVRGEELHDGYMNAVYKNKVDFAIMLSNPLESQYTTAAEWVENVLPYITEHYFKSPNYKVLDNQLVVYTYNLDAVRDLLHIEDEETGTVTQDGLTELMTIIKSMDSKAVELGYDGIMFVVDRTSMGDEDLTEIIDAISDNDAAQTCYKWRYTWNSDVVSNITNGITNDYTNNTNTVASIPMGFENIPWQYNEIGILEPSEIETICNTVVSQRGSEDPKLVLFTCWDEWGEGHFHSPSSYSGFDYLNAARKTLTTQKAALGSEDIPTDDAVKRMGVLYPEGRQILKVREDKRDAVDPAAFTTELGTLTPSRDNYEDRSGCTIGGTWLNRDYTTYDVTSASQASVWFTAPDIDYSKVTAIKVVGYAQNSASLVVKYGLSGSDPFGDETGDNRFRFSCSNPNPEATTSSEYILTPDNPTRIAEASGINYIRFNTQQNTSDGGTFHIEKIVFYSDPVPETGVSVNVDDIKYTLTSKSISGTNGTVMLPAYRLLLEIGAKVTWDKSQKVLTATKDGVTAIYQNGFRNVVDENNTILATATEGAPHTYQDGNIFIDCNVLLKPFGYTMEQPSATNVNYYSEAYYVEIDETDYRWDFNKDGDREGWSLADGGDRYFMEGGYAATVKDGVMHLRAAGTDTNLWLSDANLTKAKTNFFTIKLDTDATQMLLRLYDSGTYASGAGWTYTVTIPAVDGPQEIIIDLSQATDRDGNLFSTIGDTITKVRLDPIYGKTGSNYVDYIQFTKDHPYSFSLEAYSFGENVFTDYTAAYWNSSGTANSSGWGISTLTDDGDVKIQISEGQTNGITGITWLNSGSDLASVVTGKIVRVSFDYKGVGDITSFRFENRDTAGSPGRDGEEFTQTVTSDWQHFDGYINVDEVTDGRRWFGIRATRSDSTGDDYLVVRDWQIRVLDESTEVTMFTDAGVAIKAVNNTGEDIANDKVHVGAYDTTNRVLTGFTSGNVPNEITVNSNDSTSTEESPYYYMAPIDATNEIRAFWWDTLEPVTDALVLPRAN